MVGGLYRALLALGMIALTGQAPPPQTAPSPPPRVVAWQDPSLDDLTATRLERFANDAAMQRYARDVGQRANRRWSSAVQHPRRVRLGFAEQQAAPECPPEDPACNDAAADSNIVVTAARAPSPNVTNVQSAGVDEGDIVKQIGDFLAILQDGRITSVDTRSGRLALVDRINVYRSTSDSGWYDEMLVQGDRLLITSYSYRDDASEISVFRLDRRSGRLSRQGSWLISSEDYYSSDNYASRIIGDNLVIYTPYDIDDITDTSGRPRIRRWMTAEAREALENRTGRDPNGGGRPLFDARSIYRPLLRTIHPQVHTITICPLADYRPGAVPNCRATGFVGPEAHEMLVVEDAVYLWMSAGWSDRAVNRYPLPACATGSVTHADMPPAMVYRIPVDGGAPSVVSVRGYPFNQFSFDAQRGHFRALLNWPRANECDSGDNDADHQLHFVDVRLNEFSNRPREIAADRHIPLPTTGTGSVENRFADDWLVYGGRVYGYGAIPDSSDSDNAAETAARPVFVVPIADPRQTRRVDLDHNVIRIDRVGADRMIVNGYRDDSGLSLSLIQLGPDPVRLDTARLAGRYESEGRSHAFNAQIDLDRHGILGVPTLVRQNSANRWEWFSEGSDVSFLTVAANGRLGDAGPLIQGDKAPDPSYTCEVSCIDWYGNSRPIFIGSRIFALMESQIAEGRLLDGRMQEVGRLNLTQPVLAR